MCLSFGFGIAQGIAKGNGPEHWHRPEQGPRTAPSFFLSVSSCTTGLQDTLMGLVRGPLSFGYKKFMLLVSTGNILRLEHESGLTWWGVVGLIFL